MIIQSHRGAGNLAPENTLESFDLGWSLGTVPEADIRFTKDGVMVAFHDNDFSRVVKDATPELAKLGIEDLTWDELGKLEVGAYKGEEFRGQRIPEISAVFEAMRGRPERMLYIDIKRVHLDRLASLAREYGVIEQVMVASTDYAMLREWKSIAPESTSMLWMGGAEERLRERMAEFRAAGFEGLDQIQIHVRPGESGSGEPFNPPSAFLREVGLEIKRRGILFQAIPWGGGADRAETYHGLMSLGVESFASDEPKVAVEAVASHRKG